MEDGIIVSPQPYPAERSTCPPLTPPLKPPFFFICSLRQLPASLRSTRRVTTLIGTSTHLSTGATVRKNTARDHAASLGTNTTRCSTEIVIKNKSKYSINIAVVLLITASVKCLPK